MVINTFALQEWCNGDLILLHKIKTKHNWSNALTKPQSRLLFYGYMNYTMGHKTPKYTFEMLGIDSLITKITPRLQHEIEGGGDNTIPIPT